MDTVMYPNYKTRIRRDIVLLLWSFIGLLYFSLASQWITTTWRDRAFAQYMDHMIQVAANEQRDAKEIRALILLKAADLSLPIQSDEVRISGTGRSMAATVHYKTYINMPIVNQPLYLINFDHDLKPGR